jgi:hypothetical protein
MFTEVLNGLGTACLSSLEIFVLGSNWPLLADYSWLPDVRLAAKLHPQSAYFESCPLDLILAFGPCTCLWDSSRPSDSQLGLFRYACYA